MPQIKVNVTDVEIKAVEGVVIDAAQWLQEAWNGKAACCVKRVINEQSDKNYQKMSDQERIDWIKNNMFKTRKQKDKEVRI